MGAHDFKLNMVLLFARKPGYINVSRSAAPKLALMPASRFTVMSISQFSMSVPSFIRIERGHRWRPMTSNLTLYLFFARKHVDINVFRHAAPELALVPASRYYCDVN